MTQAQTKNKDNKVKKLFKEYIEICNKAIAEHQNQFPYKEMISLSESCIRDSTIDLAIYDDMPKGVFSLHFKDKKLVTESNLTDPKKAWRMNLSYLEKVVENPQKYIDHPEKLDLDWLKSRMGL